MEYKGRRWEVLFIMFITIMSMQLLYIKESKKKWCLILIQAIIRVEYLKMCYIHIKIHNKNYRTIWNMLNDEFSRVPQVGPCPK